MKHMDVYGFMFIRVEIEYKTEILKYFWHVDGRFCPLIFFLNGSEAVCCPATVV